MKTPSTTDELCRMDDEQARTYLEGIRWPNGACCPHCGSVDVVRLSGKATRPGVHKCRDCVKQFTVTVGTIFERSHCPLRHWVYVFARMCASKKGISAHQIHRELGITYKTAWFMAHRVRHAMDHGAFKQALTGVIEADETWIGGARKIGNFGRNVVENQTRAFDNKTPVLAVVERGGKVRTRVLPNIKSHNLAKALKDMTDPTAHLMTDNLLAYRKPGRRFRRHQTVNHTIDEYVKPDTNPKVHTNTVEGFFSLLKRGVNGTFHHISREHLHRYCSEFEHRYNSREQTDVQRTALAIKRASGKRLTYKRTDSEPHAMVLVQSGNA